MFNTVACTYHFEVIEDGDEGGVGCGIVHCDGAWEQLTIVTRGSKPSLSTGVIGSWTVSDYLQALTSNGEDGSCCIHLALLPYAVL